MREHDLLRSHCLGLLSHMPTRARAWHQADSFRVSSRLMLAGQTGPTFSAPDVSRKSCGSMTYKTFCLSGKSWGLTTFVPSHPTCHYSAISRDVENPHPEKVTTHQNEVISAS
jgi:hypothetical protein